ncbi:hypothetical protein [Kangiella taiwanensis]|uniref:Uncharacterized protein n=1 Tax=Kangiella taiwanensis TaxID=1079179 RepID=A0ABP8HWX5_9GAMM|nr:hypothetical protein [Kangiella taiwanensis]
MKRILNIVPNENWQLIIEFIGSEYRLLNTYLPRDEFNWGDLAYPQHMKRYVFTPEKIIWEFGGELNAEYLYEKSVKVDKKDLESEYLRLGYKNQAPTKEDKRHHVYYVYLRPFTKQLFSLGESIGGGHAERGGGRAYSYEELLLDSQWQQHFELSGCSWAIPIIKRQGDRSSVMADLIDEARYRNGL